MEPGINVGSLIELSADDDPSGQQQENIAHRGRRRAEHVAPAPRLISKPIVHRIRICRHCGIGQAVAYKGDACQHCKRSLAT